MEAVGGVGDSEVRGMAALSVAGQVFRCGGDPVDLGSLAIWQQERDNAKPNRFIVYGALLLIAIVAALWLASSAKTWPWKIRSPIRRPKIKTPQEIQAEHEKEESTLRAHRELSALYRGYAKPAFDALKGYVDARRTELEGLPEPLHSIELLAAFMAREAEHDHREENNLEGWTEFIKLDSRSFGYRPGDSS
jgi:hypothetical protein